MNNLAKFLTDYIIKGGMVNEEERSMYEYGFLITLEAGLSLLVSLMIAIPLHMVPLGILFFIIFIPLRSYAGGLHMDHYWACLALSCLTFSVVLLIVKFWKSPIYMTFAFFICLVLSVWLLFPVDNINRATDEEEKKYFKKRLKIYLSVDVAIAFLCIVLKKEKSLFNNRHFFYGCNYYDNW